jgi:hypothetical protein
VPYVVQIPPGEETRFQHLARSVTALVGCMHPRPGQLAKPVFWSGVLVSLGGSHFIVTAGHGVKLCDKNEDLIIGFADAPRFVVMKPGEFVAGVIRPDADDPDVAVIELTAAHDDLWRAQEPLTLAEFGDHAGVGVGAPALLLGNPSADMPEPTPAGPPLHLGIGVLPHVTAKVVPYATTLAPPLVERTPRPGFYVFYEDSVFEDDSAAFVHPNGFSGGPILSVGDGRRTLLGVARAFYKPRHLHCEPAWHALQFLRDAHPRPAIRAVAARGLSTLGRG